MAEPVGERFSSDLEQLRARVQAAGARTAAADTRAAVARARTRKLLDAAVEVVQRTRTLLDQIDRGRDDAATVHAQVRPHHQERPPGSTTAVLSWQPPRVRH